MEWINIEKKWHEMALRLQIVAPHRVPATPLVVPGDVSPDAAESSASGTSDKSVVALRAIA